jgi:glycosyltransferase involved in cell wall biosynthesis
MNPLISVIVPTFNRAKTISRTIDSILNQTYQNFEIIIVDDGSEDATQEILKKYSDIRLRIFHHKHNKGVTAAKNTGLNNIHGEWFTILDSDDEIIPEALEIMIKIPLEKDSTITAITCNCTDTSTGTFSGKGLTFDRYVDFNTLITQCEGEFWGITKTELLLNDRFNERLWGFEGILWFKTNERANRYYIHEALRIYHTEGNDRVSKVHFSLEKISNHYQALSEETYYLQVLKTYWPKSLAKDCLRAVIYLKADKKKEFANFYFNYLRKMNKYNLYKPLSFFVYYSHPFIIRQGIKFWKSVRLKK